MFPAQVREAAEGGLPSRRRPSLRAALHWNFPPDPSCCIYPRVRRELFCLLPGCFSLGRRRVPGGSAAWGHRGGLGWDGEAFCCFQGKLASTPSPQPSRGPHVQGTQPRRHPKSNRRELRGSRCPYKGKRGLWANRACSSGLFVFTCGRGPAVAGAVLVGVVLFGVELSAVQSLFW